MSEFKTAESQNAAPTIIRITPNAFKISESNEYTGIYFKKEIIIAMIVINVIAPIK